MPGRAHAIANGLAGMPQERASLLPLQMGGRCGWNFVVRGDLLQRL